jgi:hypothetical protein
MGMNGADRQARHRAKRAAEVASLKARLAELEGKAPEPKRTAAEDSARNAALLRQLRKQQAELDKQQLPRPPVSESARNALLLKRNDALERENKKLRGEIGGLKSTWRRYLKDQERVAELHQGRRRVLVLPKKVQTGILKCLHPDTGPHVDAATRNALTVEFLAIYPR